MRLPLVSLVLVAVAIAVLPACGRQAPPPAPVAPISGWTATNTEATVNGLSGALAAHSWVGQFREANGRQPVVEVRLPEDRSADHVPVDEVAQAYAKALGASDRLLTASQGQVADVALVTIVGLRKAGTATFFTVDARVVDARTGDVRWTGGLELPRQEPVAPAPQPAP